MDKDMKDILNELEGLKNQVYNLNLYLDYIEKNHPAVFAQVNDHFDGMPGYCNIPNLEGSVMQNER